MKLAWGGQGAILLVLLSIVVQVGCSDTAVVVLPEGQVECHEEQIALGLGEWTVLPAAEAICLVFTPTEARYAIAYYDSRLTEQARWGSEQPWPEPHWFDVRIGEGELRSERTVGESSSIVPLRMVSGSPAQPSGTCAEAASDEILCRPQSWVVGDTFRVYSDYVHFLTDFSGQTAQVVASNGHLVFAALEQDLAQFKNCEWCQGLVDSVGQIASNDVVPLLRSLFTQTLPVTSPANGQLLVLVHSGVESQSVGWISDTQFHVLLQVSVSLDLSSPEKRFASRLVHELTHTFQRQYAWERDFIFHDEWAKEGGADLIASDFLRRRAGIALDANFDAAGAINLQTWQEDPDRFLYAISFQHTGEIASGYQHAANMLRDFVIRRCKTGEPDSLAMQAVLRGALEGWYGATTAETGDGLSNRMKQRLGQDWDPVTAVLTWTLSNAVDDRTASSQFQNPALLEAWNPEGPRVSWLPADTYELSSGRTLQLRNKIGSTGYLNVEDPGDGGTLVLRSDQIVRLPFGIARSGVRWALIRFE